MGWVERLGLMQNFTFKSPEEAARKMQLACQEKGIKCSFDPAISEFTFSGGVNSIKAQLRLR